MSIAGKHYAAFLFDMDGTLLSSIAAAERVWTAWAVRHGIDIERFLPTIHGVRAEDTIRRQGLSNIDIEAEVAWVEKGEIEDVEGVYAIDGVIRFLRSLPIDRWAIVTSATAELAGRRLAAAGIERPPTMITAEDVSRGKPAPDCFLLAAERLGVKASDCLVFEDAPAGIEAAKAAGADVLVLTATHTHPVALTHRSVRDYQNLSIELTADGSLTMNIGPTH